MYGKTIKQLLAVKDELNEILDVRSEKLLDSVNSFELQTELQRNVIDYITETIEQIDIILENIESGGYDDDPLEDSDDEDYY